MTLDAKVKGIRLSKQYFKSEKKKVQKQLEDAKTQLERIKESLLKARADSIPLRVRISELFRKEGLQ